MQSGDECKLYVKILRFIVIRKLAARFLIELAYKNEKA